MLKVRLIKILFSFSILLLLITCSNTSVHTNVELNSLSNEDTLKIDASIKVGAEQLDVYLSQLKGKRVGVVGNQTSVVGNTHLVDTLLSLGVDVKIVFAPEHGFRGDHDAGADVAHGKDAKTGLPIFSLHGKTKKPSKESLDSVDVLLFDIQDVGVRFYTYISTLHYVMEAAAENNVEVIVLDRPNPNAHYIDGPILEPKFKSFIGMHPVPVVYGMTIGEYAKMINGEYWLKDSLQATLSIVELKNWDHQTEYVLPVAPSPNLPNQLSIYLYPSLCFFEGTIISVGRGTEFPFQVYGHPAYKKDTSFSFTPVSIQGKSKYPKLKGKRCFGKDLRLVSDSLARSVAKLDFSYLMDMYPSLEVKQKIFDRERFFNLLAGNSRLLEDLKSGKNLTTISKSWEQGLKAFKETRKKYLIYTK